MAFVFPGYLQRQRDNAEGLTDALDDDLHCFVDEQDGTKEKGDYVEESNAEDIQATEQFIATDNGQDKKVN